VFASCSWLVVVYESETLLCTVMFVNNELRKVGHKMDGTSALDYVRLEMEVDAVGRRPPQSSAAILSSYFQRGDRCSTMLKVLCYKSEGHWFDSRWYHWNFSLT